MTTTDDRLQSFIDDAWQLRPSSLGELAVLAGEVLGATDARILIADYALSSLQVLGEHGATGDHLPIEGTTAGLCFARSEIIASDRRPGTVWVPLSEGSERFGVLELTHPDWTDELTGTALAIARLVVLLVVSRRRYTDVALRSRRAQPLTLAAELQWDLLPPLTCSTPDVSISGILEPAYSIGGDSFDFAVNPGRAEFAIVDAVGHGMAAVFMTVAAINSIRNARREGATIETAYHDTGSVIETQFGRSNFVTGQLGSLQLDTGELTWINAGHPLPLLVRDGTFIGELACRPSLPMGLGGQLVEVATEPLQAGDRVLFYTDGVVETRGADGIEFGVERLADFLVRATLDSVTPAETVRRLSTSVMSYAGGELRDDTSLLLVEYHGANE